MLSWLKKYGLTILRDALIVLDIGEQGVEALAPAGSATATKVEDTLTEIATIITEVEAEAAALEGASGPGGQTGKPIGGLTAGEVALTGAQKLQMASVRANQKLQAWFKANVPGSPAVKNSALWQQGVATIVNGVVALLNSADEGATIQTMPGVKGAQVPTAAVIAAVAPQTKTS
jgi:hypothetical protein